MPFGLDMTDDHVERLLRSPPFDAMDPSAFPASRPLPGILRNDCRLRRFEPGDIVVREAEYGNSAFYVVSGQLRVVLAGQAESLPASVLGRAVSRRRSWGEAVAQLWRNPRHREVRDIGSSLGAGVGSRRADGETMRVFLQDVPGVIERYRTAVLGPGAFFGEIAALGRSPRTATVFAAEAAELLEVRWQGLRDLRRSAPAFKAHIDAQYRSHSLVSHLRATPLFAHLDPDALAAVARQTSFETWGEFDWHVSYRALAGRSALERRAQEPVIAAAGDYPNGLLLVRSGFARLSERHHAGERTLSYLGKGHHYGLEEIVDGWRKRQTTPLRCSLRAVGYVDILVVPTRVMEDVVLPGVPAGLLPVPDAPAAEAGVSGSEAAVPQVLLEFLAEHRYLNGTAAMMIDLERCVRCDDCVAACAVTHGGNPRFLRAGPRHGRYQVAHACMHCVDPVCMIGCPTGAIQRDAAGGLVVINDSTCIGCSTCAESCPYENIRMVEVMDRSGSPLLDASTHQPILKATKCDLCREQPSGPACQNACPHDALHRIDLHDTPAFGRWLERRR